MQKTITNVLLYGFFIILPFGEIPRLQLNNGVTLNALDGITALIFLYTLYHYLRNKNYVSSQIFLPILFFIGTCILSLVLNIHTITFFQFFVAALYLLRWICYASVFFFVAHLSSQQKKKLPVIMILSGYLVVIFGYLQYFLYPNLRNLIYAGWDEHYLRLFSTFFDPNYAGVFLVLYFLFLLYILLKKIEEKKTSQISILFILSFTTCIALFLTLSRSAFIAIGVSLLFYFLLRRSKNKILVFSGIIVLFIISIIFLGNLPTEGAHMLRLQSSKARIDSFTQSVVVFKDNPIFGVGFNAYRYAQNRHGFLEQQTWESSHAAAGTDTSIMFILATTGIVGLLVYAYMLYRIFSFLWKKQTEFSRIVLSSFVAVLISSLTINSLFYAPFMAWLWILLGIIENT